MLEIRNLDIGSPPYISNPLEAKNHGTCIPWEVITLLANLPNLERFYAFPGTNWTLNEDDMFHILKYLLIVEADLQRWEAGNDNFPMLE
ncbi:hypothetical protein H5410_021915 [Solanum commersonii]|uniref:Uncharacterized protein n=1 Tax=Solanum commersonii TaxID=4109 RepID=A0A9J5ZDB6_SOLCO|nr:hypothetical protein H5410_021915 [Solanum commersonii]